MKLPIKPQYKYTEEYKKCLENIILYKADAFISERFLDLTRYIEADDIIKMFTWIIKDCEKYVEIIEAKFSSEASQSEIDEALTNTFNYRSNQSLKLLDMWQNEADLIAMGHRAKEDRSCDE